MSLRWSLVVSLTLLMTSACLEIPELEPPGAVDGGVDARSISITWLSPEAGASINGALEIRMEVTGPVPERVELWVDGTPVAQLVAPYEFSWETWSVAEGLHVLTVRATRGGQVFISPEREVRIDRTRPRLIAQLPGSGSTQTAVNALIQATFSEPLSRLSVSEESVRLTTQSVQVEASVLLSEDGRSLTIVPSAPMAVGSTFSVEMASTVTDVAGNPVELPQQGWSWSVPAYLLLGEPLFAGSIEESSIADTSLRVGRDAHPVVAWTQSGTVHAKHWNGEGWESLGTPLAGGAGNDAIGNALQIDPDGRPMLAWREYGGGTQGQVHVRRWNGTAWEPMGPFMTTSLAQGYIRWMGFCTGSSSLPVIAWHEYNSSQAQVVMRQWDGSNWNAKAAPLPLNPDAIINYLGFDLDASGQPVISYRESSGGTGEAGRVAQWNGTSWTDLSEGLGGLPTTRLFAGDGKVLVGGTAWVEGGWRGVVRKWDGGAWVTVGEPMMDIAGGTAPLVDAIALDTDGAPVVVVSEAPVATETASRISQTRRWTGEQWVSVGGVLRPAPGRLLWGTSQIALMGDEEPIVLWREKVYPADTFMSAIHVHRLNH
ncbi:Ig-like domain-containing protein [Corallococcus sp. RDP092CA]|uniref:Ig-like domain-containing protein n=1 Tax=Corallococcus sp. RDP092CA TaxID=3109369 RepID=UPI0035B27E0B